MLTIAQNTEPKKIIERLKKKILKLSILIKNNGDSKVWSIKQMKDKTIRPVIKPFL